MAIDPRTRMGECMPRVRDGLFRVLSVELCDDKSVVVGLQARNGDRVKARIPSLQNIHRSINHVIQNMDMDFVYPVRLSLLEQPFSYDGNPWEVLSWFEECGSYSLDKWKEGFAKRRKGPNGWY